MPLPTTQYVNLKYRASYRVSIHHPPNSTSLIHHKSHVPLFASTSPTVEFELQSSYPPSAEFVALTLRVVQPHKPASVSALFKASFALFQQSKTWIALPTQECCGTIWRGQAEQVVRIKTYWLMRGRGGFGGGGYGRGVLVAGMMREGMSVVSWVGLVYFVFLLR